MTRRRIVAIAIGAFALASLTAHAQDTGDDDRIIVSGASGNLGGLTVQALLDNGIPANRLILVSRTPEELSDYAALGASTRFGDFTEPDSLAAAYAGGKRMLLISIGGGNLPASRPVLHQRAIDAAVAAGVEHIAYTSWIGISGGETDGISSDHLATENILRDSGVAWTMLRNSIYMDGVVQQAAQMVSAGRAVVPPDESPIAYITRADCAAAAATVISTPGHENKIYDITGPALIGTRELAAAASAVTGKTVEIVAGSRDTPAGLGNPATAIASTHVETLIGRPPTSVLELLEANKGAL
jgi:NAD(P)H dehydrogenase (quinone)